MSSLEIMQCMYRCVYIITSFSFSRKANYRDSCCWRGQQRRRYSDSEVLSPWLPRPSVHLEALWRRGTDLNAIKPGGDKRATCYYLFYFLSQCTIHRKRQDNCYFCKKLQISSEHKQVLSQTSLSCFKHQM